MEDLSSRAWFLLGKVLNELETLEFEDDTDSFGVLETRKAIRRLFDDLESSNERGAE